MGDQLGRRGGGNQAAAPWDNKQSLVHYAQRRVSALAAGGTSWWEL